MDEKLKRLNYIICLILGVSVLTIWLPFDDGGYYGLCVMMLQLVMIFYYHKSLKCDRKAYIIFTSIWLASNVINCVVYCVVILTCIASLDNIDATASPLDAFYVSLIPALLQFICVAVTLITIVLFIEFGISCYIMRRNAIHNSDK